MTLINNRYRISNHKLGSGSFSVVYEGTDIQTNDKVAIKQISLAGKRDVVSQISAEIDILKKLDHKNIVQCYDTWVSHTHIMIVMELCDVGSLQDVIIFHERMGKKKDFNREANTHYYLSQLKDALSYLKDAGYIHRDIKPMNILLTKEIVSDVTETIEDDLVILFGETRDDSELDCTRTGIGHKIIVKLADFGLAREYEDNGENLLRTYCGSPRYMGPELLLSMKYNSKTDLWSYGVIMYEMLFGKSPIDARNISDLKRGIIKKDIDFHLERNYSVCCYDLLTKLLAKESDKRIAWDDFFSHTWFTYWNNYPANKSISILPDHQQVTIKKITNLTQMTLSDSTDVRPGNYLEYHTMLKQTKPIEIPPRTNHTKSDNHSAPHNISKKSYSPSNNSMSPNSPLMNNPFINKQALHKTFNNFSV